MRTLAELDGVEFLRQCNLVRKEVAGFLDTTKIMEIRKRLPKYKGNESEEKRVEIRNAQLKKNLSDMLDSLLEEHPEETYKLIMCMVVLDEGEEPPKGFDLLMIALELLTSQQVIDFLSRLMRSGLIDTLV